MPSMTTLAPAPMAVRLPPKSAPMANATYWSAVTDGCPSSEDTDRDGNGNWDRDRALADALGPSHHWERRCAEVRRASGNFGQHFSETGPKDR